MSRIIISDGKSLPRDLDVVVNISKAQTEGATDFSVIAFVTPDAPFRHDANRIKFYMTLDAVLEEFAASSEVYKAASAFFSQTPRPKRMAVAKVFTEPVSAFLQSGLVNSDLTAWKKITNGTFAITIDGVASQVESMNFSGIKKIEDIADVVESAIRNATVEPGFRNATVEYLTNGTLLVRSGTTGDASAITKMSATGVGTDISGENYLNCAELDGDVQPAYVVPGYAPQTLVDELAYVKEAAEASGQFVYGWVLDKCYRDQQEQFEAARWAESQTAALLGLTFNSPLTYDASSINDVASLCKKSGFRRYFGVYHNNSYYYPEMSILAYALSVNYSMKDSTITTKFKNLQGIPTVPISVGELSVLQDKNVNTFTAVGNNARTFREGMTGAGTAWYIDDLINLDNFREEIQVAVFNTFLKNKKIPYTDKGTTILRSPMANVCEKYIYNGTFATRTLSEIDTMLNGGISEDPAYTIEFTPVSMMTDSDRAKRIGPPASIRVNMAGAIHSIEIGVNVIS